jgi:aminopeptidase N
MKLLTSIVMLSSAFGCVADPAADPSAAPLGGERPLVVSNDLRPEAIRHARAEFVRDLTAQLERGAPPSIATDLFEARRSVLSDVAAEINTPYDVLLYNLDFDIDSTARTFAGELDVLLLVTRRSTEIVLDVGREETLFDGTVYNPYAVTSVRSRGRSLDFVQDRVEGELRIRLRSPARLLDVVHLTIEYDGTFNPDQFAEGGLLDSRTNVGTTIVQTFGWPDHARMWLPSVDHPRDPASWIVNASIDDDRTLLSNGTRIRHEVSAPEGGPARTEATFVMLQPVPTYALQILAGDYVELPLGEVDSVPVSVFVYPEHAAFSARLFAELPAALEFFNAAFGDYPFARYSMVETPSRFGGMEHATIVSLNNGFFFDAPPTYTGARDTGIHELSHHWFGDNLHQSDWPAFWLNESLATYATNLAIEHLDGYEEYERELRSQAGTVFFGASAELDYRTDEPPGGAHFSPPYYKGPWIWHMLRVQLGDEVFFDFLHEYTISRFFRKYDTASLITALEDYTGRDFTNFFDEWVYAPGFPRIEIGISGYDGATGTATVYARQVQMSATVPSFTLEDELALEIALDDGDPATAPCIATIEFPDGVTEETATVACATEPSSVTHLNDMDILAETFVRTDPTLPCPGFAIGDRECGWTNLGSFDCVPGASFELGCGASCGLGTCSGDPMIRICDGETWCPAFEQVAGDDQSCGNNCPIASVTCPASGRYTVLAASWVDAEAYACMLESR